MAGTLYFLVGFLISINVIQRIHAVSYSYTKIRGHCGGNDIRCTSGSDVTFKDCKQRCDGYSNCVHFLYDSIRAYDGNGVYCCAHHAPVCTSDWITNTDKEVYTYVKDTAKRSCDVFMPNNTQDSSCATTCSFTCSANCNRGVIYGDTIYTGDSDVCSAAIHSGVIPTSGGKVFLERLPGQTSYATSIQRHGVTSTSFSGRWFSSFKFENSFVYTRIKGDCGPHNLPVSFACTNNDTTFQQCKDRCDNQPECHNFLYDHEQQFTQFIPGRICCLKTTCPNPSSNVYSYVKVRDKISCNQFLTHKNCQTSCSFQCPAGCTSGVIYGDGYYSSDSDVCTAAVHNGIITTGGTVYVRRIAGQSSYHNATRKGITSIKSQSWYSSFTFDCLQTSTVTITVANADVIGCSGVTAEGSYCPLTCKAGFKPTAASDPYRCQYGKWSKYSGDTVTCQACSFGEYGKNCSMTCSSNCNNGCNRFKGHCNGCKTGWEGNICDGCADHYYKENSLPCTKCSVHCSDVCNKGNGHCNCKAGWNGNRCDTPCADGKWGLSCANTCSSQCTATCNKVNGGCNCKPGYGGLTCTQVLPHPVGEITLKSRSADQVTVEWNKCTPTASLTGYTISAESTSSSTIITIEVNNQNTLNSAIMTTGKGQTYNIKLVCKHNVPSAGSSLQSQALSVTTCSDPTKVPMMQRNSTMSSGRTLADITVSFSELQTQSEIGCDSVKDYIILYNHTQATQQMSQSCGVVNTCKLVNLVPYTNYTLILRVTNNADYMKDGSPIVAITAAGVPPKMQTPDIVSSSAFFLITRWNKPSPPHGIITKYEVILKWLNGTVVQQRNVFDDKLLSIEYKLTNLMKNQNYTVQVRAYTNLGPGEWSDKAHEYTAVKAPSVPLDFAGQNMTTTSIIFTWKEPRYPSGIILEYMIHCSNRIEILDIQNTNKVGNMMTYALIGLMPAMNYQCRIAAKTSAGYGPYTSAITVTTLPDKPVIEISSTPPPLQGKDGKSITVYIPKHMKVVSKAQNTLYEVIVHQSKSSQTVPPFTGLGAYNESVAYYITARLGEEDLGKPFVVGDGKTYGTYTNIPLVNGEKYDIWFSVVNIAGPE